MTDNNGGEKSRIIKTQDENGEVYSFELIDVLEFESREYGLLAYIGEGENPGDSEGEEEEVVIMRLSKSNDSYTFETIEDDEEFNRIISYLETESDEE